MLVLWVWIGVVVFAAVVFAFCAYEVVWKSRRLHGDLEKLNGLSESLATLQTQVTATQLRLAEASVARGVRVLMVKVPRDVRRRSANPEGRMAVMDHLRELRRRLIIMVIIVALGGIIGWIFYPQLLEFLKHPYCNVPEEYRVTRPGQQCSLVYFAPLDGFTTRLKVSVIAGAVFTGPLWLYQIWAFITPGLRKNERKYTVIFVIASTILFAAGMSLAYVVLSKGLRILIEQAGEGTQAQLAVADYISFVTLTLVIFGAAFELPLLVIMANLAGVLSGKILKKSQRIGVFLIFLFAAIATPSTDPFTMCAMAIPMVILFEGAVLFAVVHDKRKAKRKAAEAEVDELDDDVASTIDPIPSSWHENENRSRNAGVPGSSGSGESWNDVT